MVLDGALERAAGEGVVHDRAGDDAVLQVADILPAQGDAVFVASVRAEAVAGVALPLLFGRPTPTRPLETVKTMRPLRSYQVSRSYLVQDGELDAVDGAQLVEGEAEGHGGEYVDFDEGLAAGVVGAEGDVAGPGRVRAVKKDVGRRGSGLAQRSWRKAGAKSSSQRLA